jgi:uncharacterized protein YodC (DUF2158 family)
MAMGGNSQVQAGDLVRLKSGGPVMTAERVLDHLPRPFALCVWFDARPEFHRSCINLAALERAEAEEMSSTR